MADLEKLDREAPVGAFSTYDAEILIAQLEKLEPGQLYLEVGVDKGKSLWISKQVVKEGVEVHGVDLREDPGVTGAVFHRGDSVAIAKDWDKKIDVLFIDGDHSYEGCKRDIEAWLPHLKENGVMLFHDCDESSPGVVRAVSEFVDTYKGVMTSWKLFKRTDKNTSISEVQL